MRTTVSEMGPILFSRLLDLNDTQSGVMSIIFKIADDEGLLLLDLKDLRKMVENIGNDRDKYITGYGNISSATIGAIQRGLLALEEQGGEHFFGEPAINIQDLMQNISGKGVINIMASDKIINSPKVYTSFLLYLLSELFEQLSEVGDMDKPKLMFFFDEAHLLFNDISKSLLDKIEQVVRLIRSKGVGIYFCTQNPLDIPDSILGQMGNRIQHALRAFTPRDQKAVSVAARTFRQNPDLDTESVITELAVGEALVSFLDDKGTPSIVERAIILPPESQAGAITPEERSELMKKSLVAGVYERETDRESAFEILSARTINRQRIKDKQDQEKAEEKELKEELKRQKAEESEARRIQKEKDNSLVGSLEKMATNKIKKEMVNTIFKLGRGLLGSFLGGK